MSVNTLLVVMAICLSQKFLLYEYRIKYSWVLTYELALLRRVDKEAYATEYKKKQKGFLPKALEY